MRSNIGAESVYVQNRVVQILRNGTCLFEVCFYKKEICINTEAEMRRKSRKDVTTSPQAYVSLQDWLRPGQGEEKQERRYKMISGIREFAGKPNIPKMQMEGRFVLN